MDASQSAAAMRTRAEVRRVTGLALIGIGAATAGAHLGNNFTAYLIGGLIDRYGFTPIQMGVWSMAETLAYAAAMFLIAPRIGALSPRGLLLAASALVAVAQSLSATLSSFPPLLVGRVATGLGFGLANTALNLAAGRTDHPARAISAGIAFQTMLYAGINILLPIIGARHGVSGMFLALAVLSALFASGAWLLPGNQAAAAEGVTLSATGRLSADQLRVLIAMALFTYGSLAIWPFIERAAHAIAIPATQFGRYQSLATLASAAGSLGLAAAAARLRRTLPLAMALVACGGACAALTLTASPPVFATALVVFNASWFVTYPLILGIAYAVDGSGRLAVLCSATWLAMTSLGSLSTGVIAELAGGYAAVGPIGLGFCVAAAAAILPLARRLDEQRGAFSHARPATTG